MAVRRQLLQHFREPRIDGAIMVERAEHWPCTRQQTAKAPESPSVQTLVGRLPLEACLMYQCQGCRTVLGDSLHLCESREEKLRLAVCFKVTNDVVVDDSLMVCAEGDLSGCTYNVLNCRSCERHIGFKLYCSKSLAYLRGFFCLFEDSIICYSLKTKTCVKASKMTFPAMSLTERVQKLKDNLVLVHTRIELLIKKLEELTQQRSLAEKSYNSRPYRLGTAGTRKKLNH